MSQEGVSPETLRESEIYLLGKAESSLVSNAREVEDEFQKFYSETSQQKYQVIQPPFNPALLERIASENNALEPCIAAMETNIDGTGFTITREDGEPATAQDEQAIARIEAFFAEVWPGMSFTTLRRRLRRDLHTTGNAYIEVLRNATGTVVFLRRIDPKLMRLVRLDAPVTVTREITRNGETLSVNVDMRERRFAQVINNELLFFKEFGASRDVDKNTGDWATGGLSINDRGTEIIHLRDLVDTTTPYGVPRWISQLPSVLGSRKAEEFNLEFFDSGGIPPVMIFLQGGLIAEHARQALDKMLSTRATTKHRAVLAEIQSTGGSIDKGGNTVKIDVERFGSDRQSDSMFEKYDERCFERVRTAFRLPPIFCGKSQDYNYASARASYEVAEAQVFSPERQEFDEVVNGLLMSEIGGAGYRFRSKKISITDADTQMKAIGLAGFALDPESKIDTLNEITGLDLKMSDQPFGPQVPAAGSGFQPKVIQGGKKADLEMTGLVALAREVAEAQRTKNELEMARLVPLVQGLGPQDMAAFKTALSLETFGSAGADELDLVGCTLAYMARG